MHSSQQNKKEALTAVPGEAEQLSCEPEGKYGESRRAAGLRDKEIKKPQENWQLEAHACLEITLPPFYRQWVINQQLMCNTLNLLSNITLSLDLTVQSQFCSLRRYTYNPLCQFHNNQHPTRNSKVITTKKKQLNIFYKFYQDSVKMFYRAQFNKVNKNTYQYFSNISFTMY